MSSIRFPCLSRPLCLVALFAVSCSQGGDSTEQPNGIERWSADLQTRYGVQFDGLAETDSFVDDGGALVVSYELLTSIPELGQHKMVIEETIFTAADGGGVMLRIEDTVSGDERLFFYYPEENQVLFSQDQTGADSELLALRGTTVQREPDGTYQVIGFDDTMPDDQGEIEEGQSGYEALRLVEKYADFSTIGPHVMLTAAGMAHFDTPEARTATEYGFAANRPAFCSIFSEFCDCAACSVMPAGAGCQACPKLSSSQD